MINNYGNKMKRNNSNSKLAQFKAAVAHLPFTEFNETSDSIVASYVDMGDPTTIIEVDYNPNYKGISYNFTIYRNDIQTDSYGTYDIDEFVEQLEPYFNLGNEVSLLKQLDRRLTKLEMYNNLAQQELNSDSEVEDELSLLLQEEYLAGTDPYVNSEYDNYKYTVAKPKFKTTLGNVELDETTVGYVKRKDGKLIKRKLVL